MQPKKQRKVIRHKLPNLRQPGLKFDNFKGQPPMFFSKINNTYKLLQQPILTNEKKSGNLAQTSYHFKRKQTISLRMNELAKPKSKLKQNNKQQKAKQGNRERSMSLPYAYKKKQVKTRYSHYQIDRTHNNSQNSEYETNKQGQIIGTGLGTLPLQKILAHRQQQLRKNQRNHIVQSDSDSQNNDNNNFNNLENNSQDFAPQQDFMKWLQKIIGNQGKLYQQYQKGLFEKISLFQRKRHKINHQNVWK